MKCQLILGKKKEIIIILSYAEFVQRVELNINNMSGSIRHYVAHLTADV